MIPGGPFYPGAIGGQGDISIIGGIEGGVISIGVGVTVGVAVGVGGYGGGGVIVGGTNAGGVGDLDGVSVESGIDVGVGPVQGSASVVRGADYCGGQLALGAGYGIAGRVGPNVTRTVSVKIKIRRGWELMPCKW